MLFWYDWRKTVRCSLFCFDFQGKLTGDNREIRHVRHSSALPPCPSRCHSAALVCPSRPPHRRLSLPQPCRIGHPVAHGTFTHSPLRRTRHFTVSATSPHPPRLTPPRHVLVAPVILPHLSPRYICQLPRIRPLPHPSLCRLRSLITPATFDAPRHALVAPVMPTAITVPRYPLCPSRTGYGDPHFILVNIYYLS